MSDRPRVLALVGPTGTGKTEFACALARHVPAEIISVDSMQVYRGMDIGTAKPSRALREAVPHHGIDLVDPDAPMSAGHFATYARRVAREILARGRAVILCGGTGLYARAFTGGLVSAVGADPALRRVLSRRSLEELQAELEVCDPAAAQRIHPRDRVRIERALEISRLGARPASTQRAEHAFEDCPFDVRWIGLSLERARLWERLRERVEQMFDAGLVEEVRGLYAAGYPRTLRSMQAIGYREVGAMLAGEIDEPAAREAIFLATRRYAKRQRTWFKAEPGLVWVDAAQAEQALELARKALVTD